MRAASIPAVSASLVAGLAGCQPAGNRDRAAGAEPVPSAAHVEGRPSEAARNVASLDRAFRFRRGQLTVIATFHGAASATVVVGERALTLHPLGAASGARYGDDAGNELWTKGLRHGVLILSGEKPRDCSGGPDPAGAIVTKGPAPLPAYAPKQAVRMS